MYERYMVKPEDIRNVKKDGRVVGFDMHVKSPYYTDVSFEDIATIQVRVDNILFSADDLTFSINGETYQMQELETSKQSWELKKKATIHVPLADGVAEGTHIVELGIGIRSKKTGNVHPTSNVCYISGLA